MPRTACRPARRRSSSPSSAPSSSSGSGRVPLLGPDEPRYTRVAVEMHRAGEWVTPTLQGEPWLEKPPLFYWLAGGGLLGPRRDRGRGAPALRARRRSSSWGRPPSSARALYGSAAGLHAGFVAGTVAPALRLRPRGVDGHAARGHGDAWRSASSGCALLGIAGRLADRGGRGRAPASPRSPRARSACCCRSSSLGGYLARHPRVALAARARLAPRRRGLRRRRRALVRRDPPRPGPPLPRRLHPRPQRPALHLDDPQPPGPVLVLRARAPRRALPVVGPRRAGPLSASPRARRAPTSSCSLWLGLPLAFFSLAGSKLPGYILPCVPPLAILMGRAADRLSGGPARPSGSSRAASPRSSASCSRRSSPRRPPRSSASSEPLWRSAVPLGVWALVVAFLFSRRVGARPGRRAAAAAHRRRPACCCSSPLAAPPDPRPPRVRARGSSPAPWAGEVLAWGAWRTAWMAGYFYNDGKVREVEERDARSWRPSTRGRRSCWRGRRSAAPRGDGLARGAHAHGRRAEGERAAAGGEAA